MVMVCEVRQHLHVQHLDDIKLRCPVSLDLDQLHIAVMADPTIDHDPGPASAHVRADASQFILSPHLLQIRQPPVFVAKLEAFFMRQNDS